MKHLLALKAQIVAFDIEFVTPQVEFDFSSVTSTFWELRERGGLFNPRNLFRLVGGGLLPRVVENMLDAKAELDGRLRTVINDFINAIVARILVSIADLDLEKRSNVDAAAAVQAARSAAEKEAPFLRSKAEAYLEDVRIRETLIEAVYEQVVQRYESFYEAYRKSRNMNGKAISSKGKGREDEVWEPDIFSDWVGKIFQVGKVVQSSPDENDDDGDSSSTGSGVSRAGSV